MSTDPSGVEVGQALITELQARGWPSAPCCSMRRAPHMYTHTCSRIVIACKVRGMNKQAPIFSAEVSGADSVTGTGTDGREHRGVRWTGWVSGGHRAHCSHLRRLSTPSHCARLSTRAASTTPNLIVLGTACGIASRFIGRFCNFHVDVLQCLLLRIVHRQWHTQAYPMIRTHVAPDAPAVVVELYGSAVPNDASCKLCKLVLDPNEL